MKKQILTIILPAIALGTLGSAAYAALGITSPTSLIYVTPPSAHTTLQSYTKEDCAKLDTYTTVVLTDTRDSKQYRIRKMPDSRCWMIDNLALATGTTINSTNTDIQTDAASDFISTWNTMSTSPVQNTSTHGNGECTAHSSVSKANGSGNLTCNGATYDGTNHGFIAYSNPAGTENSTMYENCLRDGISTNSLTGCGYLYNWYTATAGSGIHGITSANVNSSVCPIGWKLPKALSPNEFGILNNAMGTGATTATTSNGFLYNSNWHVKGAFEGALSGSFTTSFSSTGNDGYYWSSSATSSAINAYNLYFSYNLVSPGNSGSNRNNGRAIRCVL